VKHIIFFSGCWKATPTRAFNEFFTNIYEFFLISENSLKFANFFAEVTNSRSIMTGKGMQKYLLHLCCNFWYSDGWGG